MSLNSTVFFFKLNLTPVVATTTIASTTSTSTATIASWNNRLKISKLSNSNKQLWSDNLQYWKDDLCMMNIWSHPETNHIKILTAIGSLASCSVSTTSHCTTTITVTIVGAKVAVPATCNDRINKLMHKYDCKMNGLWSPRSKQTFHEKNCPFLNR